MLTRKVLCVTSLLWVTCVAAQVTDDFSDGDLTEGPIWVSSDISMMGADFSVNTGELQSAGPASSSGIYISTYGIPDLTQHIVKWEFKARYENGFTAPSSSNYIIIYLLADISDLSSANGYYIRMGESGSGDGIDLFKAGVSGPIIEDAADLVAGGINVGIRVTRDENALWTLEADPAGGVSYSLIGTYQEIDSPLAGSYFGFLVRHSSTKFDDYYFDDVSITATSIPDIVPPAIRSAEAVSQTQFDIIFNEEIEEIIAETTSNYNVDGGILVSEARRDDLDHSIVHLTVSDLTNGETYIIMVNNITDLNENTIVPGSAVNVEYLVFSVAGQREVVINEFMADPTPSTGLPETDFVELYNPTANFFNVENWTLSDNLNSSDPFLNFTLRPDSYVIICDLAESGNFNLFGDVIGVSNFPNFNGASSDSVILRDSLGQVVDALLYNAISVNGVTAEQINPTAVCSDEGNFLPSTNLQGGTPGTINSVFDNSTDLVGPAILDAEVFGGDSIVILFSELMDESRMDTDSIQLDPLTISDLNVITPKIISISLDDPLTSEQFYEIEFSDFSDCSGNRLETDYQFYYDVAGPSIEGSSIVSSNVVALKFNEPIEERIAENESNYRIEGVTIATNGAQLQDSSGYRVHLAIEEEFSLGEQEILIYNLEDTSGNVMDTTTISVTYRQEIDTVQALSTDVLQITFSKIPDSNTATDPFNYLIDRGIGNPTSIVADQSNAAIVRLQLEKHLDENEEYQLYAEHLVDTNDEIMITPAKTFVYDTKAPQLEELFILNDSSLNLQFDESLAPVPAINLNNYRLNTEIRPLEVILTDFNSVMIRFDNSFEIEAEQKLTYANLQDLYGNQITTNRSKTFTYDPIAPGLDTAYQLNDTVIRIIASEPVASASVLPSNFCFQDIKATAVKMHGPDSISMDLYFNLIQSDYYGRLDIINWADRLGNELTDTIRYSINTIQPLITSIRALNDTTVAISYSMGMDNSALNFDNYSITGMSVDSVYQNESEYFLDLDTTLMQGESYALTATSIQSFGGQPLQFEKYSFEFEPFLNAITVTDSFSLELSFDTEFDVLSTDQFNTENTILFLTVDPEDPGTIKIIFENSFQPNSELSLSWNDLKDRWQRQLPDYSTNYIYDAEPPQITGIESEFFNAIRATFSESVDADYATAPDQYKIVGIGNPATLEVQGNYLLLEFETLTIGQQYQLVYAGISDLSGNFNNSDTIPFIYDPPAVPGPGDIIITEIMADPTPSAGLPEIEYLELFNRSDREYQLTSLILSDENSSSHLPVFSLDPGSYVVLSSSRDILVFDGQVVDDLPSLDNNGDSLRLTTVYGELVDKVQYHTSWYRDENKDEGGYSLELINPESECPASSNWVASGDAAGGTPGRQNSVYSLMPDTVPPEVVFTELIETNQILVKFNEFMDSLSLASGQYIIEGRNNFSIEVIDDHSLLISFAPGFLSGRTYEIFISEVADCSANTMGDVMVEIAIGDEPLFGDIIFTEIMSDPDPPVGLAITEYLEIYNASEKVLSLDSLRVVDDSSESGNLNGILKPGDYALLVPSSSVENFPGVNAISVSPWTSLSNGGQYLELTNGREVIFNMIYSRDWFEADGSGDGGYSLEMGGLAYPCQENQNWKPSIDPKGGTPGFENSHFLDFPDYAGPELITAEVISPNELVLDFDERLQPVAIGNEIKVWADRSLDTVSSERITFNEPDPSVVNVKLIDSLRFNTAYTMEVQGLTNCTGSYNVSGSVSLFLPEVPESGLVISEILFDPVPNGVDFVEVHNTTSTSYFDLSGLSLSNEKDTEVFQGKWILEPESYVVFTENKEVLLFDFPRAIAGNIVEVDDLPSLPNDEGILVMKSVNGSLIDSVYFNENFHSILLEETEGVSLERLSFQIPAVSENNWHSASSMEGFATPGYANSQSTRGVTTYDPVTIEPRVFIPGSGNLTHSSFTTINYQFDQAGLFANIDIYDQNGNFVINLAKGASLSTTGFVQWDGTTAKGTKARIGRYIVVFEVYGGGGERKIFRKNVVVATDF